jgi:hypothetical protein
MYTPAMHRRSVLYALPCLAMIAVFVGCSASVLASESSIAGPAAAAPPAAPVQNVAFESAATSTTVPVAIESSNGAAAAAASHLHTVADSSQSHSPAKESAMKLIGSAHDSLSWFRAQIARMQDVRRQAKDKVEEVKARYVPTLVQNLAVTNSTSDSDELDSLVAISIACGIGAGVLLVFCVFCMYRYYRTQTAKQNKVEEVQVAKLKTIMTARGANIDDETIKHSLRRASIGGKPVDMATISAALLASGRRSVIHPSNTIAPVQSSPASRGSRIGSTQLTGSPMTLPGSVFDDTGYGSRRGSKAGSARRSSSKARRSSRKGSRHSGSGRHRNSLLVGRPGNLLSQQGQTSSQPGSPSSPRSPVSPNHRRAHSTQVGGRRITSTHARHYSTTGN